MTDYALKPKSIKNDRWVSIKEFAKKNLLYIFNKQKKFKISDKVMEDLIDEFG